MTKPQNGIPVQYASIDTSSYSASGYACGAQPGKVPPPPVQGEVLYEGNNIFRVDGYKDLWAAVLFGLHVVGVVALGIIGLNDAMKAAKNQPTTTPSPDDQLPNMNLHAGWVAGAGGVAVVVGVLLLTLIRSLATGFIWTAQIMQLLATAALAVVGFYYHIMFFAVLMCLVFLLHCLWLWCVRNRIPFASLLLRSSSHIVFRNAGLIVVSYLTLVLSVVYTVFWIGLVYKYVLDGTHAKHLNWGVVFGVALAFYWACQVFSNVSYTTSSGVAATWYFTGEASMPDNATSASFSRATTTSFGSICFGSLIVAILRAAEMVVRGALRGRLRCVALCILSCIEAIMVYFNLYAYSFISIYGMGYMEASSSAWNLVISTGFAPIINDCLVFPTIRMVILFSGALIGVVFGLLSKSIPVGILGGLISLVVLYLTLRVVVAGVITLFVCVAQNFEISRAANPEFHGELHQALLTLAKGPCQGDDQE